MVLLRERHATDSKEEKPRVDSSRSPAAQKPDRWASRYVSGTFSPDDSYLSTSSSAASLTATTSTSKVPFRASTDHNVGFGMPSRISKDLRTTLNDRSNPACGTVFEGSSSSQGRGMLSTPPSTTSTASASRSQSSNRQDYSAPILKGSDGALSKVCGSLIEPSASRNKWACHDCKAVFARDTTIYAPPSSATELISDGAYFCRQCYGERYALGRCQACQKEVLGSTKEDGKFVKAAGGLWHGRCWRCMVCEKGARDGVEVLVGMDGKPCCDSCFDKPKQARRPSIDIKAGQPMPSASFNTRDAEARRLSKYGAASKGPMGATIAELSKKFNTGCTTATSPTLSSSPTLASELSMRSSTSAASFGDLGRSPSKGTLPFPDHRPCSPTRRGSSLSRSGSITGSPPKPRPMTAQFTGDLNLAAFRTSIGPNTGTEGDHVSRSDSRSRSHSPTRRIPLGSGGLSSRPNASEGLAAFGERNSSAEPREIATSPKVPGSPNAKASASLANANVARPAEFGRDRTISGFLRPLNTPFSKNKDQKEPLQGDKSSTELEAEPSNEVEAHLPASEAEVKCVVCNLLPFESRVESSARNAGLETTQEVVMITLSGGHHLHADCFTCAVCTGKINGSRPFTRLEGLDGQYPELSPGLGPFAHPHCAPSVRLQRVVREVEDQQSRGERTFNRTLHPDTDLMRTHVTHQRELRPSPTPSPAASLRAISSSSTQQQSGNSSLSGSPATASAASSASNSNNGSIRRFQPSAGAAPPTRSAILSRPVGGPNPAAGIFSRLPTSASASSSSTAPLTSPGGGAVGSASNPTTPRFGGMPPCAYCGLKLSALESVTGPRGTAWHRNCLVCRGEPKAAPAPFIVRNLKAASLPICGKKLDSGAKVNRDGEVRCRDCFDRECSSFRVAA